MSFSHEEKCKLLSKVVIFANLSGMELRKIADLVEEQRFLKNSVIIKQGDPGEHLFVIGKGKVKITKGQGNEESLVAILQGGDAFGELAIFDLGPRSATVTALEELQLLLIHRDKIRKLMQHMPDIAIAMLETMAKRVRIATDAYTLCQS